MSERTLVLTDENFESQVLQSDVPVLVDVWAPWCMPCLALGPVIEEIAAEFHGRARVGKLDTDSNPTTAARLEVQAIPTVLIFKEGRAVERFVGLVPKDRITDALESAVGTPAGA